MEGKADSSDGLRHAYVASCGIRRRCVWPEAAGLDGMKGMGAGNRPLGAHVLLHAREWLPEC